MGTIANDVKPQGIDDGEWQAVLELRRQKAALAELRKKTLVDIRY